jgi:hypothetical protein
MSIQWSDSAYVGTDYGLNSAEQILLASPPGSTRFNDIATVYAGSPYTLTFMQAVGCSSTTSYLTFAEQTLAQLTTALKSLVNSSSISTSFIVEASTGYMVAASIDGQVAGPLTPDFRQSRVLATGAPDGSISSASRLISSFSSVSSSTNIYENDSIWVAARLYTVSNLAWVLVTVIPKSSFIQSVQAASAFSIGLSLSIIIIGTAILVAYVYFTISLPIKRLQRYVDSYDTSKNDEFAPGLHAPAGRGAARELNALAQSLSAYSSRVRLQDAKNTA